MKTGIRLRFGLGGTDDLDGLEENHDPFVEVICHDQGLLSGPCAPVSLVVSSIDICPDTT